MTDKHFIDWYSDVFPYGYGTGDEHYLRCLKQFFSQLEDGRSYSYKKLESALGCAEAWFIINILCKEKIIEYGTSTRFAWIRSEEIGISELRDFVVSKTTEELYELVMVDESYIHCYPTHCNCETLCRNPLFPPLPTTQ